VDEFDRFVEEAEPRLRRALVAVRGPVNGREAVAEALAYAWEHWDRIRSMENPVGYLYRVGQSRTRQRRRLLRSLHDGADGMVDLPEVEPGLTGALRSPSDAQRAAVFLVHGCDWSHAQAAEALGCSPSTVSTHVQRGMARLRDLLEVTLERS
jgi:DNA-directed RNA polymerase specialized sigma24 family protein